VCGQPGRPLGLGCSLFPRLPSGSGSGRCGGHARWQLVGGGNAMGGAWEAVYRPRLVPLPLSPL
jgi:hypothetical protein